MRAILSILGLYQYSPDIFDLFKLPDGVSLDSVRDNILMELAELELLEHQTAPRVGKTLCNNKLGI